MKVLDLRNEHRYNALIPAVAAICQAKQGETLELVTDNTSIFNDLKEFLAEQHIGFREIYDGDKLTLQFTK